MNISILGPQGCGKGTQAQKLADKFGLVRVEVGKILREIAASDDPDAKQIETIMLEGRLVPDEIWGRIISAWLDTDLTRGFVFDGSPRNIVQYELMKKILQERGLDLDLVIFLDIPETETVKRLSNRRTCKKCNHIYNLLTEPPANPKRCTCGGDLERREDDTPTAIVKRLQVYRQATIPVLNMARQEKKLIEIDGTQTIEQVYTEITEKLGARWTN